MDLAARFISYADDFERAYADRNWQRLAPYFTADAVYECKQPEALAFRVVGRGAILERFATVTDAFDRRFDSRTITFGPPRVDGARVSITGVVLYTLSDAPPLRLPFTEVALYRAAEIVHLEDASTDEALAAVADWMARYGDRLPG
jgi:hypothetical protein